MTAPAQPTCPPVTLYVVIRPDGTVIDAKPSSVAVNALHEAARLCQELDGVLLAFGGLDFKSDIELAVEHGFSIEPVTYAPVNEEREVAVREMREALGKVERNREYQRLHGAPHFTSAPTEMEMKEHSESVTVKAVDAAIARFDRAEGRVG